MRLWEGSCFFDGPELLQNSGVTAALIGGVGSTHVLLLSNYFVRRRYCVNWMKRIEMHMEADGMDGINKETDSDQ
jgi:hypothetical protein